MVIYKITNRIDGKIYIGQTTRSAMKRICEHKCKDSLIGKAIKKFGLENFQIENIERCDSKEELNLREKYWTEYFDCIHPKGYNKAVVDSKHGEFTGFYDRHHSKETIALNQAHQPNIKKVMCVETGIVYNSIRECERETGEARTHIIKMCKGQIKKTKHSHFEYVV